MVARRPALKLFLARFFAPAVLGGAIGAYIMARRIKAPAIVPAAQQFVSSHTAAETPAAGTTTAPASSGATGDQTPADVEQAAREAENMVLLLQRKTMALG